VTLIDKLDAEIAHTRTKLGRTGGGAGGDTV
jgi:hypothetical protein